MSTGWIRDVAESSELGAVSKGVCYAECRKAVVFL